MAALGAHSLRCLPSRVFGSGWLRLQRIQTEALPVPDINPEGEIGLGPLESRLSFRHEGALPAAIETTAKDDLFGAVMIPGRRRATYIVPGLVRWIGAAVNPEEPSPR
jgi:hypothetical protein